MTEQIIFLGLVVFASHMVEGITGFGCMILALPFAAGLLGLQTAVPVLVVLSTCFDLVLVLRGRSSLNWRVMLFITAVTAVFIPAGFWGRRTLPEELLTSLLGVFILVAACINMLRGDKPLTGIANRASVLFLPLAGVVQGAFGGSGPIIVLYSRGVLADKTAFRSTMAAVWELLNLLNLVQYGAGGMLTSRVWELSGLMLPFIAVGYAVGELAHRRISAKRFGMVLNVILIITGISMLV